MSYNNFTTSDWVKYLLNLTPAAKTQAMDKVLGRSERQRAILRGLELMIQDKGLSLDDSFEDIMAALEALERRHEQQALVTLERVSNEMGLLDDIELLLQVMQARHDHEEAAAAYLNPHETVRPKSTHPDMQRLEELIVESTQFLRREIGQARASILEETKSLIVQKTAGGKRDNYPLRKRQSRPRYSKVGRRRRI